MGMITGLRTGRGRQKRIKVILDKESALSLEPEVVAKERLRVGQELSADQVEALVKFDQLQRCLNIALHYLSYRPRSESELRGRLRQRGFGADTQEAVITRLKERGLVDDIAFAQFWKDNRETFSPRSQRLTRLELKQKGVANDIIEQVIDDMDDDEGAFRVALSKAHTLPRSDFEGFYRQLGGYLKRRGFGYRVIHDTVERLWQDRNSGFE